MVGKNEIGHKDTNFFYKAIIFGIKKEEEIFVSSWSAKKTGVRELDDSDSNRE